MALWAGGVVRVEVSVTCKRKDLFGQQLPTTPPHSPYDALMPSTMNAFAKHGSSRIRYNTRSTHTAIRRLIRCSRVSL